MLWHLVYLFGFKVATICSIRALLGPKKAGQLAFLMIIVGSTLPAWFVAKLGGPLYSSRGTEIERKLKRRTLSALCKKLLCIGWRIGMALCPWIRVDFEGVNELRAQIGRTGRPVCIVMNHTSFLDIFLGVMLQPLGCVGDAKMIVSSHVFKMPIMGELCKCCGHLAVPFKTTGDGSKSFEIDKDGLAKVMEEFEQHLKDGGACAWFPEGQVNRGDCSKLQQFRAGGMGIAVRNDVELWCVSLCGNANCWPGTGEPCGGIPAHVKAKAFRLCESSKELLAAADCPANEREQSIYMANITQEKIQAALTEMTKQGYNAGDNTKKIKDDGDKKAEDKKAD